jgi:hypothetical protein
MLRGRSLANALAADNADLAMQYLAKVLARPQMAAFREIIAARSSS